MSLAIRVAVVLALLAFVFCAVFVRSYGTPFHTVNGGLYLPAFGVGVEVWGHPGPFACPEGC